MSTILGHWVRQNASNFWTFRGIVSFSKTVVHGVSQSVRQIVRRVASQRVSHSVTQPASQSGRHSASQTVKTEHSAPYAMNPLSIALIHVSAGEWLASVEHANSASTLHLILLLYSAQTKHVNKI